MVDDRGIVHHEFLRKGGTTIKEYYLQVNRSSREAIHQKIPNSWILHQNNVPSHNAIIICQ